MISEAELQNFYYLIGFFVVTGFSSLVAGVIFIVKKAIWMAKLEFRIEKVEKDINAAFMKIRDDQEKIQAHEKMKETIAELSTVLSSGKSKQHTRKQK